MSHTKLPLERIVIDQHNDRLKLFDVLPGEFGGFEGMAGKLVSYARAGHERDWSALGFRQEGLIRGFFGPQEDAQLWCAYPDAPRQHEKDALYHALLVQSALDRSRCYNFQLPCGYRCQRATPDQALEIASLMQACFPVYPTPLHRAHIQRQIAEGTSVFRVVRNRAGNLVALASAELDPRHGTAELTDCATRADQRGRGLMACILAELTRELEGSYRLFSLARAGEAGINCVLRKIGFHYTGRLINNCRMPTGWESVNIWCQSRPRG